MSADRASSERTSSDRPGAGPVTAGRWVAGFRRHRGDVHRRPVVPPTSRRPVLRWLRGLAVPLLGVVVVALGSAPAWAHDYLVSSSPAAGSVQTSAPSAVRLSFDDIVLTSPAEPLVEVVGPDGRHYETGCATVLDRDVTTPVALGPAGSYTVTWRVVSADGHPVTSSITFDYQPAATGAATVEATGAAAALSCGSASSAGTSTDAAAVSSDPTAGIVVGIAVVTVLALVVVVVRSRRRRS